ncbi:hypothetical protein V6N13_146890 [Hibiscus sabdariffa]|uniref:DJ-1/PfpI domain-containing protein n=1 Tax=Hibiscus sabdariffa TaxID=183260 RepID=A0ABR2TU37_9ROSI
MAAFSLPQPHFMRTKLCDLKDDELDPMYAKKREQWKELVASVIRPKIVQGNLQLERIIETTLLTTSVYDYDCLVVLGGRSVELLVMNDQAVDLMKEFAEKTGPLLVLGMGKGNDS